MAAKKILLVHMRIHLVEPVETRMRIFQTYNLTFIAYILLILNDFIYARILLSKPSKPSKTSVIRYNYISNQDRAVKRSIKVGG